MEKVTFATIVATAKAGQNANTLIAQFVAESDGKLTKDVAKELCNYATPTATISPEFKQLAKLVGKTALPKLLLPTASKAVKKVKSADDLRPVMCCVNYSENLAYATACDGVKGVIYPTTEQERNVVAEIVQGMETIRNGYSIDDLNEAIEAEYPNVMNILHPSYVVQNKSLVIDKPFYKSLKEFAKEKVGYNSEGELIAKPTHIIRIPFEDMDYRVKVKDLLAVIEAVCDYKQKGDHVALHFNLQKRDQMITLTTTNGAIGVLMAFHSDIPPLHTHDFYIKNLGEVAVAEPTDTTEEQRSLFFEIAEKSWGGRNYPQYNLA